MAAEAAFFMLCPRGAAGGGGWAQPTRPAAGVSPSPSPREKKTPRVPREAGGEGSHISFDWLA